MNRAELIDAIISQAKEKDIVSHAQVERTVVAVFETIKDAVANGDEVAIANFGTFKAVQKNERTGRNPQTGETITIPACKVPRFKAGKGFKNRCGTH